MLLLGEMIELKNKLSIPLYKKVILYAPTWRDSNDRGNTYGIKPPMDVKKWERHQASYGCKEMGAGIE